MNGRHGSRGWFLRFRLEAQPARTDVVILRNRVQQARVRLVTERA
jgi:hypothetical protein